jgi:N-acetylglucosamine-6-phosphate deacetylase
MRLGAQAALVDGGVVPGDVIVEDGEVVEVGAQPAGHAGLAVPGFVDLQVNGFGGVDLLSADGPGYRRAGAALAATGVTAYQPTIISSAPADMRRALADVGKAQAEHAGPRILGAHVEGPFLSPRWKGAHDERHLALPDLHLAARLCTSGPVTYMTIAPELPGGFDLLDWLVDRGIVVALGHSDADAATAHAAYNRGARALTHLHNAQRRFASRDPGVSGVSLVRPDVTVGVIADLVHLAPETLMIAWFAARGRVALVTDAIAAAPARTGTFMLGDRQIRVGRDVARLPDGTLAGSVLTLDRAVRNLVGLGVPLPDAVAAATAVPARLVGHPELGTLRPRTPADIAVLDSGHRVVRTLVGGREEWATG